MVSVIIPCFNQAHYLPEAVRSLQAQTYLDWECIVINDGSTDTTEKVAAALAVADGRVRVVNQCNRGLSGARNRGLAEACGQFIQFLDADDVIMPKKFEVQLGAAGATNHPVVLSCDYCFGMHDDVWTRDPERIPLRSLLNKTESLADLALNWETQVSIPCHCFLFDARLFRDHGVRFSDCLKNHEDWDCWMRVFSQQPTYGHIPQELAVYRNARGAMSKSGLAMRQGFLLAIRMQQDYQKDAAVREALQRKLDITKRAYAGQTWVGKARNWFGGTPLGSSWRKGKGFLQRLVQAD